MSTAPSKRQVNRLPPERRIADIMNAAREVFREFGYADALISDIAERAGVVEGTIYRFFTNKRDLLQRVAERWAHEVVSDSATRLAGITGEKNQLYFLIFHHLNTIRQEPSLSRLVWQDLRTDSNYRETELFAMTGEYTRRVYTIIERGIATGLFRKDVSPALVRDMIYGTIEHRTMAFLRDEVDFDPHEFAESITEMIYSGLLPRGEASTKDRELVLLDRLEALTDRLEARLS